MLTDPDPRCLSAAAAPLLSRKTNSTRRCRFAWFSHPLPRVASTRDGTIAFLSPLLARSNCSSLMQLAHVRCYSLPAQPPPPSSPSSRPTSTRGEIYAQAVQYPRKAHFATFPSRDRLPRLRAINAASDYQTTNLITMSS